MAQIEKTNQIDKYLDQIDKKQDSSFKKKLFLLLGLLFITVSCIFAYNQFAGKDTLANNSTNAANASNLDDSASSVYVNDDSGVTDSELIAELEAEEEAAAALLEKEAAATKADENEPKTEDNKSNDNQEAKETASTPRPGVSQRTFTAAELPSGTFSKEKPSTASPKVASSESKEEEVEEEVEKEVLAEADVLTPKGSGEENEEPAVVLEVIEAEPEAVVEEAPKGISKNPSYPGGESKMRQFFSRRITYPSQAINNKIEGSVNVKIKVDKKGKIIDSQVVKGIGSGCDREVLRAINRMPKWEPAMENGQAVPKHYLLSVAFKLPE